MFSNVVWASDGSAQADRALEYATALARRENAVIHIVHVIERLSGPRVGSQPMRADEQEIQAKIEGQADALRNEQGIDTRSYMVASAAGAAAKHILEIARSHNADLIVVGSRGHSAIAGAVLGSVAQRLLHLAPCPVFVVPPTAARPASDSEASELSTAS